MARNRDIDLTLTAPRPSVFALQLKPFTQNQKLFSHNQSRTWRRKA